MSIRESFRAAKGIVDLEFDDATIAAAQREQEAMIGRLERGETTFEEEDARLMEQWNNLKDRAKEELQ